MIRSTSSAVFRTSRPLCLARGGRALQDRAQVVARTASGTRGGALSQLEKARPCSDRGDAAPRGFFRCLLAAWLLKFISQPTGMRGGGGPLRPALAPGPEGMDTGQVGSRRHEERAQHGRLPIPQRSGRSAATIELNCHTMIVKIHPSHKTRSGFRRSSWRRQVGR